MRPTPTARDSLERTGSLHEFDGAAIVAFPLRGEWTVQRTPADRIPSHGTDLFGQRYAYDLVRTDGRFGWHVHPAGTLRWVLLGGRTQDCYGWGEPVHAALGGDVVQVVDDVPERARVHVVREAWAALRNAAMFGDGRRTVDARRLAGNHVVTRAADDVYLLYAHLAADSVEVTRGQRMAVGDVVGRVGHTGNSTAPHLHFHAMDSADPARAHGIPCAFSPYLTLRADGWQPVRHGIPRRRERIASVA